MTALSAIALAGGSGVRARPLTLTSPDYLRSKAALSLVGRSLIEWAVTDLREQGVEHYYVVARGRENRAQIKEILGHGERHGISVRYSRARFDQYNTGSGEATLRCLDHWGLDDLALIFPTDSVFDFDLGAMVAAHQDASAVVTVAAVSRPPRDTACKYGVLVEDERGLATGFAEKPPPDEAEDLGRRSPGDEMLRTNAGMYLVDCAALRRAAADPGLAALARESLDWAGDLLPYLIAHGHRVAVHPISKFGDLGNPRDYLETLKDVLNDGYPMLSSRIDPPVRPEAGARVHESSLHLADGATGRTLAQKLRDRSVRLGPNVRIGRDVEIGADVVLADSDIADGVDVGSHCTLRGVACGEHSIIGPAAKLTDVVLGCTVEIGSTEDEPVVLTGFTAIGDEARVRAGVRFDGVTVFPRLDVHPDVQAPPGTTLATEDDMLRWSGRIAASRR